MLRNLRDGAGVRVLTGPEGVGFWLPVSVEVRIEIVPDDFEVRERCEPDMAWALQAVGMSGVLARGMVRHYGADKGPTPKAATYARWQAALELLERFNNYTEPVNSIIVEAHAIDAVTEPAEMLALLDRLDNVALDYEWNIDEAVAPLFEPEGLGVAVADRTWYFPLICSDFQTPLQFGQDLRRRVMATIQRTATVWHNAKADLGAQWLGDPLDAWGSPLHDTLVMAFVAGYTDLALKPLARSLLGRDPIDFPGTMRNLPLEVCRRYGGADARNTYDLVAPLYARLQEREQVHIYESIERPIIPLLTSMERYGLPMDMARAQTLRDEMGEEEEAIRARFLAEEGLDLAHDKDTRELIKRRAGHDPGSLAKDAIAKIEGEWMDAILRYRQVRHRRRAFLVKHIEKWEAAGQPTDWRAYFSLNQAGQADQHDSRSFRKAPRSGRLSSSSPDRIPPSGIPGAPGGNGQNQPSDIKEIFIAPPGKVLWDKDYSQLELRIAAAQSHDPGMLAAVNGGDPHSHFQQRIFDLSGKTISRTAAKQGGFNSLYGGMADMLRIILMKQRVFLPDDDLQLVVDSHRQAYPGLYDFDQTVIEFARITGYAATAFGRRRYDDDIFSTDVRTRLHAERALVNHAKGQGTAADILKLLMGRLPPLLRHYGAHLSLQVHDELLGWCDPDVAPYFLADMDRIADGIQLPGVHLALSGGAGANWAAIH